MPKLTACWRMLVLLAFLAPAAAGQALPSQWDDVERLPLGTAVRVTGYFGFVTGALLSATDTALVISTRRASPRSFSKREIGTLSIKKDGGLRNTLIAVGVGVGVGAVASLEVCQAKCNKKSALAFGLGLGAVAGVGEGMLWRWRRIYLSGR